MAASFLVAGLMLTPAPLNAFAESELTTVEAGQPSTDEQAPEAGETTEATAQEDEQTQASAEQAQEADEQNAANPIAKSPDQNQRQTAPVSPAAVDGEHAVAANSLPIVYVSQGGNDETGDGTAEHPLKSLEWAVTAAAKDATINVMTDLDARNTARYYDKRLTIKSVNGTHTIKRSKDFGHISDTARSWYNGGLIEVGSVTGANDASLTLENITLDDQGIHFTADEAGEKVYFIQAQNAGGNTHFGSEDINHMYIAQDSIIATYGGTADITLGNGATLKNFGGMSAVRMAGGKLTMMDGSKIVDDASVVTDRIKGTEIKGEQKGLYGPAGALWIQGGTVDMQKGSEISGIVGRAIYEDGGNVTVNGSISNIKGDLDMWQEETGVAVHTRGGAKLLLGATGSIDGIVGDRKSDGGRSAVNSTTVKEGYSFEMKQGASIKNVKNISALDLGGKNLVDGLITGCEFDNIIRVQTVAELTIDSNAVIENNKARTYPQYAIVYTTNGSKVVMNGTVRDNDAKYAFYVINQSGGGAKLEMSEGALVQGRGTDTGVYINASNSEFTMNGGTITGFSKGVDCRGKNNSSASFTMNDGRITGNSSCALDFNGISGSKSVVNINGGTIENNGNAYQINVVDGKARDAFERIKINPSVLKGNTTINLSSKTTYPDNLSFGQLTLDDRYDEIWLGIPRDEAKDKIKTLVQSVHPDWTSFSKNGLWFKPSTTTFHFTMPRPDMGNSGICVAYIPLNEDGTPVEGKDVTIQGVNNDSIVDVTLDKLTAGQSYALMFVNNNEYTLKPDTTTIYTGGKQGEDNTNPGFPVLSIANSVDSKSGENTLEINGKETAYKSFDALMADLLDMLEVTYVDADGNNAIKDDTKPGAYTAKLAWKESGDHKVKINGNDVVGIADGSLIVRHVSDIKAAQDATNTNSMLSEEPTSTSPVTVPTVIEKALKSIFGTYYPDYYLNGDESRKIDKDNADISLMWDAPLLGDKPGYRQQLLEDKVAGQLGEAGEGRSYRCDFKYLDLVDANNGNAWVSAEYGSTVYLPYPDGLTMDSDIQLVHFKGLNREYGINGQPLEDDAINASTTETMKITKTEQGIKFEAPKGDFGLYALAWKTAAHTIEASVDGEGGTIAPDGTVTVGEGADKTFDITPAEGYIIADVKVDGTSVGPVSTYIFEHVKEDHAIVASFRKAQHTITATAGEGGTIDPAGNVAVKDGGDQKFTIKPNKGYKIADVKVDGQSVGKVTEYTFSNVTADHAIEVTFEAEPVIPAHKHTWGDWQYDGKSHWHVCTVCGETADKAAHTWSDWTVVTQATETTDGLREHVCEVCGCKVQEVIPATGKKPNDKGENKDENKSDSKKDTDNKSKDELPATGDASSLVAAVAAAGAAATVAGAAALRKRDER